MSSLNSKLNEDELEFVQKMVDDLREWVKEDENNLDKKVEVLMENLLVKVGFPYDKEKWGKSADSLEQKELLTTFEEELGTKASSIVEINGRQDESLGGSNVKHYVRFEKKLFDEFK